MEDRCDVLPVGRPTTVRLPTFIFLPKVLEKMAQDVAEVVFIAPYWPQRLWFFLLLSLLVVFSQGFALSERHFHATHVSADTSQCSKSSFFTLATFRQQGKKAGLS